MGACRAPTVGGSAITYAYDGMGRRTARTESGATEQYLYGDPENPWQLTASRDAAGQLTQYFYDPYGRLVGLQRGAQRFYVFTDPLGSPRLVTDSTGATVKRIDYDAYGDVITDSAPTFELRVGFAGGLKDPTSGLVQFGLRDYEPASGRWTSRDPILFNGGQTNLYAYVDDDPVNFIDSNGTGLKDWVAEKIGKKVSGRGGTTATEADQGDRRQASTRTRDAWSGGGTGRRSIPSGAPELDCMLALLGENKLLNWVFPVEAARKTLQQGVKNVHEYEANKIDRAWNIREDSIM